MSRESHPVLPGGLSGADRERLAELAERGWRAPRIARDLSKNASTVYWAMRVMGYGATRQVDAGRTATRGGVVVRGCDRDEDDAMVALRREGRRPKAIAAELEARFGRPFRPRSVACRLVMLASLDRYDGGPEPQADRLE